MKALVGVTDNNTAAFLRALLHVTEANLWPPSGLRALQAVSTGEAFVFQGDVALREFDSCEVPNLFSTRGSSTIANWTLASSEQIVAVIQFPRCDSCVRTSEINCAKATVPGCSIRRIPRDRRPVNRG